MKSIVKAIRRELQNGASMEDVQRRASEALTALHPDHGIEVWNGQHGTMADTPRWGFLLHYQDAIPQYCDITWFSSEEAAMAALARVAAAKHRPVRGRMVDFTASGCHPSCAFVEAVGS